mgnify:CR=1 FL=1
MSLSIFSNAQAQDLEDILWENEPLKSSLDFAILDQTIKGTAGNDFEISLNSYLQIKGFGINIFLDNYNIQKDFDLESIPKFSIKLSSKNGIVEPNIRFINTNHEFFDFYIGQGFNRINNENQKSIVILPIAYIHKNANCVHNGVLIFSLFEEKISNSILQLSSETCSYLKFDLIAVLELEIQIYDFQKKSKTRSQNSINESKNIIDLYEEYDIEAGSFADSNYFNQKNITLFGLIDGNDHFTSDCLTRTGMYPLCDELLLPSYSLAKSIAGTITLSLLQNQFKDIQNTIVSIIPQCNFNDWTDVSFENLSDMASGHYLRTTYDYDENSLIHSTFLFDALTHNKKIEIACNSFPRKSNPGNKFVYRTSDIYILGTGINQFIKDKNLGEDYFNEILLPFFNELNLSETIKYSIRTFDKRSQAYTGWGMYLLRNDLKILAEFLHEVRNNKDNHVFLSEALNPSNLNSREAIKSEDIFYNNGFWSKKFEGKKLGCKDDVWIPFMSGFGGITFALFPNGMSYYYFSDGYKYYWENAVEASNKIRPFC